MQFYEDPYDGVIADADEITYRNGFLLDFHRNQKVVVNSILTGELPRISRCCAETIEFASNKGGKGVVWFRDRESILDELKSALPTNVTTVEVQHILTCENKKCIGHDGIVVSSVDGAELIIWFDVDEHGLINQIEFFDSDKCSLGIDYEFHLHAMYAHAICDRKWYILHEYITHGCMYRSEYADVCLVGALNIIDRFADINTRINETNAYTYEYAYAKDELSEYNDLPLVYQGTRCTINYQAGELAYVVFLMINEDHKISNILMSCNGNYLKRFEPKRKAKNEETSEVKSVVDILSLVCVDGSHEAHEMFFCRVGIIEY